MSKIKRITSWLIVAALALSAVFALVACKKDVIDNENTRLVLSTAELEGVFNPFYSSSGADGSIVGMTQISMLGSTTDGKIIGYGKENASKRAAELAKEPCVVADYDEETYTVGTDQFTRYRFVLKSGLKFSDGSPLTMRDVLFNLYEYLDPAYYGSATIYSTDIVGLKAYQTQQRELKEQKGFNRRFLNAAGDRIGYLREAIKEIQEDNKRTLTDAEMVGFLTEYKNLGGIYANVLDDYTAAKKYLEQELESDYINSMGTAEDIKFAKEEGSDEMVSLHTDTEAFLYNWGKITWNEDERKFDYSWPNCKDWDKEKAIQMMYDTLIPNDAITVLTATASANNLLNYVAGKLKKEYFDSVGDEDRIASIEGIVSIWNSDEYKEASDITVNGTRYSKPTYSSYKENGVPNGEVTSGNEVLEITINKVDPKAIWNFGFTVAPMYYYSNQTQIDLFDYKTHFGVDFGNPDFQDDVIKDNAKIGVPVGAGPYKATTQSGDGSRVEAGTFRSKGVVYFERNDHFMFPVTIKYVNYQVVPTKSMLEQLYTGAVHFVEPACQQDNIDSIQNSKQFNSGEIGFVKAKTNGYGYIGINAGKVPSLAVRKAIMHAIETAQCVDYYSGYSTPIYRPMAESSWAYPHSIDTYHDKTNSVYGQDEHYPYFDKSGETSRKLVEDAGYTLKNGVLAKGNDVLKYTFTIAGETTDHPAYIALKQASEILNKIGFQITVSTDIRALSKLNNGELTVWAAAWGAAIDPDMYQVYHKDSTAGSTSNWGYTEMLRDQTTKYETERQIIDRLSENIEAARLTTDQDDRAYYYSLALNDVMDLAVELPTYQRSDLFAYSSKIIDKNTLQKELTPYNGPLARLWEVSLNETK